MEKTTPLSPLYNSADLEWLLPEAAYNHISMDTYMKGVKLVESLHKQVDEFINILANEMNPNDYYTAPVSSWFNHLENNLCGIPWKVTQKWPFLTY